MGYKYVWAIAYINKDYVNRVNDDLVKNKLSAIEVYIPTIRLLKKQFKNKNEYEYLPLLFNYGFFKLPYDKVCNPEFLRGLKERIPAIYAWVKDKSKKPPGIKSHEEEKEGYIGGLKKLKKPELFTDIAIAKESEIEGLRIIAKNQSVFSDHLVDKLKVGLYITLKGYPYDDMPGEIVHINKTDRKVKVRLLLETMIAEVIVSFENIFYTIYTQEYSSSYEISLDEMGERSNASVDRLYAKLNYGKKD